MDHDDQLIIFGDFIKGTCELMCPTSERTMREREKLLHPLERLVQANVSDAEKPHRQQERKRPNRNFNYVADPSRIVKEFSRSAAGHKMPLPSDLRPFPVLDITVSYLIEKIACSEIETAGWVDRYNFVTDRLRAVRQDMVIQGLPPLECIRLLQPMVKFHVFAGYWLCEKPMHLYDPKINTSFLHECIKRLLVMYDAVKECEAHDPPETPSNVKCDCSEHFMYALYLIINLGNPQILNQASVKLLESKDCNSCEQLSAFLLSVDSWRGNYVKVCRTLPKLAPLLGMAAALHLPTVRRHALMVMTTAFSNKVLKFPVSGLQEILLWEHKNQVFEECEHYGISVEKSDAWSEGTESCVHFLKGSFDINARPVLASRLSWLDKTLSSSTVDKILTCH